MNKTKLVLIFFMVFCMILGYIPISSTQGVVDEETFPGAQENRPFMPAPSQDKPQEPKAPEYAPGELIVKLREGATIDDIKDLNERYGVTSTEKVFKDIPTPQECLEELKEKLAGLEAKEHKGWYWQLDKDSEEYKEYIQRIEKEKEELKNKIKSQEELIAHIEQREERSPQKEHPPNLDNIYLLKTKENTDILLMMHEYSDNPYVEYAEPNYILKLDGAPVIPNDPYYPMQWALSKIWADGAWGESKGNDIIIAIIDSGVDYTHEDLAGKVILGYDFANDDSDPMDTYFHGTMVAGIAAASTNNGIGIAGVAWNSRIMAVKTGNENGVWSSDNAKGICYAADQGADVINLSIHLSWWIHIVQEAINYAYAKGCIIVAAAGNDNSSEEFYPAAFDNVVAVAATDRDDKKRSYSNYGSWVDISAPSGMVSTWPGNTYDISGGTSAACPVVAGVMALVWSKHPDWSNQQVINQVLSTTDNIDSLNPGYEGKLGSGRVNAYRAVTGQDPRPYFVIRGIGSWEILGDLDRIPESGERIQSLIRIENLFAPADKVSVSIGINSEYIYLREPFNFNLGSIGQNETKDFGINFDIVKFPETDTPVNFSMNITSNEIITQTLNFTVYLGIGQVASGLGEQRNPSISEGKIVWEDYIFAWFEWESQFQSLPELKLSPGVPDIYYKDLNATSGEIMRIVVKEGRQTMPCISGNKIVYMDDSNGDLDIYLYDFNVPEKQHIPIVSRTGNQMFPYISENKVVYVDYSSGHGDIYLYNLDSGEDRPIATGPSTQMYPSISGDKVVWVDCGGQEGLLPWPYNSEIYLYDLTYEQEIRITNDSFMQTNPHISGNKIVWEDFRQGMPPEIYLYDLETREERRITNDKWPQFSPFIDGNRIVWTDYRNGNVDIYLYDIPTGQQIRLTTDSSLQWQPSISGSKIVWEDYRNSNGKSAIYMTDIPYDSTPSICLEVKDAGDITYNTDSLYASWDFKDEESGVSLYSYRITKGSPKGPILDDWLSTENKSALVLGLPLEENETYYFGVKAKNGAGVWSSVYYSDGITKGVDRTPPTGSIKINNNAQYTADTLVILNLLATDNEAGMGSGAQMQFSNDNVSWSNPEAYITFKSWTLTAGGGTKTVYVKFKDVAGNWSDMYSDSIVLDTTPPSAPQVTPLNVIREPDQQLVSYFNNSLSASWSASDPELGIDEYRYAIGTLPYETDVVSWTSCGNATSMTKDRLKLVYGQIYYISVKAINGAGLWSVVGCSEGILVKEDTTPPTTPVVNAAVQYQAGIPKINASWSSSDPETGIAEYQYAIGTTQRGTEATGSWISTGTDTSQIIDGSTLAPWMTYYVNVRAINGVGKISETGSKDIFILGTPPAPTDFVAEAISEDDIKLTWELNPWYIVTEFKIERSIGDMNNFTQIATVAGNERIDYDWNLNVDEATKVYYRIRAHNMIGDSEPTTTSVITWLNAPEFLYATAISWSQINLNWQDKSAKETGFKIERSLDGSSFNEITTKGANTTTYSDTGLNHNTRYHYRIRAYAVIEGKIIYSRYSNEANNKTLAYALLKPDNLGAVVVSATQINLQWRDNSSDETGFRVQRSLSSSTGFQTIATAGANVTTYSDTGLNPQTTCYYRVFAYNAVGVSDYSNVAYATTYAADVPLPPSNLVAQALFNKVTLAWQDNSDNETGFKIGRFGYAVGMFLMPPAGGEWLYTEIATVGANITNFTDQSTSPDMKYYYRICAYNANGRSSYVYISVTTPPKAPSNLVTFSSPYGISLSWQDNSLTETGFKIEHSYISGTSGFTEIATVGVDTKTYLDTAKSVVGEGVRYYRVRAFNNNGNSDYSNVASVTVP